uniref:Ribosomal protein S7 n=1 Tax=Amicula sp. isolate GU52X-4 cfCalB7 TaxID=3003489 RepID=A0A9E8Z0V2_9STRA|nr:ribosomal protein S7 [Amicula sp. isolate GU52X-4 cfCalB7]
MIKNKLINLLILDGKKKTSEIILLKSFKLLQKNLTKKSKNLIQLALVNTYSIFKLYKFSSKKKKKEIKIIPIFIKNKNTRVSIAIQFILKSSTKKTLNFSKKLREMILITSQIQNESEAIKIKNKIQKDIILLNKYYLKNFRW